MRADSFPFPATLLLQVWDFERGKLRKDRAIEQVKPKDELIDEIVSNLRNWGVPGTRRPNPSESEDDELPPPPFTEVAGRRGKHRI